MVEPIPNLPKNRRSIIDTMISVYGEAPWEVVTVSNYYISLKVRNPKDQKTFGAGWNLDRFQLAQVEVPYDPTQEPDEEDDV